MQIPARLAEGPYDDLGDGGRRRLAVDGETTVKAGEYGWEWRPNRPFIERKPVEAHSGKTWADLIGPE